MFVPDNNTNTPIEYINVVTKNTFLYFWSKLKLLLNNKVDKETGKGLSTNDLTNELVQKINNASTFDGNYNNLTNKPSINSVEIAGAKSLAELGIQPAGDYQTETQVRSIMAELVNSAPATLDTLQELAAALGNDANFATTMTTALANKIDRTELVEMTNAEVDAMMAETPSSEQTGGGDSGESGGGE